MPIETGDCIPFLQNAIMPRYMNTMSGTKVLVLHLAEVFPSRHRLGTELNIVSLISIIFA